MTTKIPTTASMSYSNGKVSFCICECETEWMILPACMRERESANERLKPLDFSHDSNEKKN